MTQAVKKMLKPENKRNSSIHSNSNKEILCLAKSLMNNKNREHPSTVQLSKTLAAGYTDLSGLCTRCKPQGTACWGNRQWPAQHSWYPYIWSSRYRHSKENRPTDFNLADLTVQLSWTYLQDVHWGKFLSKVMLKPQDGLINMLIPAT